MKPGFQIVTSADDERPPVANSPKDDALNYLKENGFCTSNIHEKNIANIYFIAGAIKESGENSPSQVALIQKLFKRFPELEKLSNTDIQTLAPLLEGPHLVPTPNAIHFNRCLSASSNQFKFLREGLTKEISGVVSRRSNPGAKYKM